MRNRRRGSLGVLASALLVATACGGGQPDTSGRDQQRVEAVGLEDALATAARATSYRITQSNGQTLLSSALGADSKTKIDEDHPTVTGEVSPDATHIIVDLSGLLGPLLGGDLESVGFEMWTEPDRIVIDTRGYAAIKEVNPGVDLGPFEPGVAFVDLAAASVDSPELVAALVGQGLPDLEEMAARLPEVLDDVERNGTSYNGTASYTDLLGALGADAEQLARSSAAGVNLNLDVELEALVDFYLAYYGETPADVTIDIDSDGAVRSVRYEVDLSGLFARLFEQPAALGLAGSDEELEQARAAFADTVWTIDSLIRFEVVPDLTVEPAPDATDDRTDEWLAFLRDAGF